MFFPSASQEFIPRRDDLSARFISAPGQDTVAGTPPGPAEEKITLRLNSEEIIGKAKFVYRGLAAGSKFKIDVAILDLDPQAYYGYRLSIDDARQGFRLAGHNFKLISARKTAIQLRHTNK
jgi:hypothetical protein